MPSFDIVSELDLHEVTNAVDQANREVDTRFDFKGSNAKFELSKDHKITMKAESDFQLNQMLDILQKKFAKRNIDVAHMEVAEPEIQHKSAEQVISLKQGVDQTAAKKIVKLIKEQKMKVQAAIQGEQVRVTGKKRDDLQGVIGLLREEKMGLPLQFVNFRD
jgi:cyclic-di-GMP-binding protein